MAVAAPVGPQLKSRELKMQGWWAANTISFTPTSASIGETPTRWNKIPRASKIRPTGGGGYCGRERKTELLRLKSSSLSELGRSRAVGERLWRTSGLRKWAHTELNDRWSRRLSTHASEFQGVTNRVPDTWEDAERISEARNNPTSGLEGDIPIGKPYRKPVECAVAQHCTISLAAIECRGGSRPCTSQSHDGPKLRKRIPPSTKILGSSICRDFLVRRLA
ncbi:hypothetical protein DFH07DRAFT_779421 [Mycena maculata]|uniref:Uncharacterized protein n=1 Tax=Mycena maculata TaxID=230809 RepID=A0AAD7I872_9AGAR|nr:hypothetical protein DFH07DRAFT_779421 [Mycena maculata]